jgi:type II secretion system (T2SS) protein E
MRIGELLIQQGHLSQEGLEEALDWQVLYGGRLGTNLLELKLVEEEQLARGLGKQLGCEVTWGDIQVDPAVIALFPKHVADRDEMVPWKMEKRRLKILCTDIHPGKMDQLGHKLGRPCVPVVAPEYRVFQLLRVNFGATRQMRALDFGVVPEEGRKRKKKQQPGAPAEPAPELIDEAAFNDLYSQVVQRRAAEAPPPERLEAERLEALPEEAILGEVQEAAPEPVAWEEPPPAPKMEDAPIDFQEAMQLLDGVSDRDAIAHIVLRASLNKAKRALLLQVQGDVALGWDGLGEGVEEAAQIVAVPLAAPSAFQLVVKTRSHFLGPLQKTQLNIRFLAQLGKKVPKSSLIVPILYRGRVTHLLYLDNGHKQQAPTDVGEMLILSQRIGQTVEALITKKRSAARA